MHWFNYNVCVCDFFSENNFSTDDLLRFSSVTHIPENLGFNWCVRGRVIFQNFRCSFHNNYEISAKKLWKNGQINDNNDFDLFSTFFSFC